MSRPPRALQALRTFALTAIVAGLGLTAVNPAASVPAPQDSKPPLSTARSVPMTTAHDPDPTAVPEGYRRVHDDKGFSLVIPDFWTRIGVDPGGTQVTYADSVGWEKYVIGVIPDAPYTSFENLSNLEQNLVDDPDKTNYTRLRLEENTFQGRPGAIWEYTYVNDTGQTVHSIDQSYIAPDGTEYAVFLTGRDDSWSDYYWYTYWIGLDSWYLTHDS